MKEEEIKKAVREGYARTVKTGNSCCGAVTSCCGQVSMAESISRSIGYADEDLASVPEGANLGLGCGNPIALASLKEGEVVLDLGSGAGFDCFLAANRVGKTGRVIGVDMTPEMLDAARRNARQGGQANVEFRLGELENLPAADNSVDVVISNCVINLVLDKSRAFGEAYRVLKPGGRLMISDLVLLKELPEGIKNSIAAYVGCLSGASLRDEYLALIRAAGFEDVGIVDEASFPVDLMANDPSAAAVLGDQQTTAESLADIAGSVVSVKVQGRKPKKPGTKGGQSSRR
ncbi:MAG: arsenite methyltransferase [Chloroflexi bacterium]|nr:arsenite methyltransferase [Chloroflexota bacterium]